MGGLKMIGRTVLASAALFLAGCSTYSSNMRVGNDMSYASLADQRAAAVGVQVLDTAPAGSRSLGKVDAGRCHRSFVETSPAEEGVILDLKIAAFARGADAITVTVDKQSGLTKNCWYVLDGAAEAIALPQPDGV